jgi:small-conductance mechanosensitive channel
MYVFLLFALRTGLFAEGRFLGKVIDEWIVDVQEFIRTKLPHLFFVAIIALVLARMLRLVTGHMIRIAEQHAAGQPRVSQVRTLAGVVRTTGLAIIAAIVGLQFLAALGVNLAPLLASAGVAGVAVGLAAQNIVRDMLNGILILLEDQFNVGDTVRLAGLAGTVEAMTLRKTTVRDGDGTLYVIPNSQITTVANLSVDYSVATINVSVDFSADPDKMLEILRNIAMEIRKSPDFSKVFLADPQILGVDAMKGSQLIFPVVFKTKATQQYAPMREFQRRVRLALAENHMLPGDPNRVFTSFIEKLSDSGVAGGMAAASTASPALSQVHEPPPPHDPTAVKPHEGNPFTGE